MARTHEEVREAAREEAFAEARRIELENRRRRLLNRISQRVGRLIQQEIEDETNDGYRTKLDFQNGPDGVLVTVWHEYGVTITMQARITLEME